MHPVAGHGPSSNVGVQVYKGGNFKIGEERGNKGSSKLLQLMKINPVSRPGVNWVFGRD